ncbi:MAG: leucine-rich repeat protein [Lachnospiraceae bacterium]|nr:leucine-rich repeat protein [Lachnospiraceae bacterium]
MKNVLRTIGVLLLVTALIIALIPVSDAEAATYAPDFQMEGSKLVKYAGNEEIVTLPSDVKSIGEEAFVGNNNIVKVRINNECETIGYGAFSNCRSLRSVETGDGVEEIGAAAFSNDGALNSVQLGASVKKLGSAVFANDQALSGLGISNANKYLTLQDHILYNSDLTKLYCMLPTYSNGVYSMPNSVQEVTGYAFWGNPNLKNVNLSSGLSSVPAYAFSNCRNLRQVTIPLPVRSIEALAFENCVNLSSVKCPESLTRISDNAFMGCPKVTFDCVPGSYVSKYAADLKRTPLTEAEYEDVEQVPVVGIENVTGEGGKNASVDGNGASAAERNTGSGENEASAAEGNTGSGNSQNQVANTENENPDPSGTDNNSAVSGNDNTEAGQDAASNLQPGSDGTGEEGSAALQKRYSGGVINGADVVSYSYYEPGQEPTGAVYGSSIVAGGHALVFIDNKPSVKGGTSFDLASGNAGNGGNAGGSGNSGAPQDATAERTGDGNAALPEGAYTPDPNETDTADPRSLGDILSDSATKGISFPKFTIVKDRIATQAYYSDAELTDYEIPDGISAIGDFAFARSALSSVSIPEGVTSIGYGAFYHCGNLENVSIPKSVDRISEYAFANTPFLEKAQDEFVIGGDGILIAYKGSDSVVTIPEGVKIIADGTFRDHQGLTAVNLPDSLVTIGENAFLNCTNLSTVNRGDHIQSIGEGAFRNTSLSSVTIPASVEKIGLGAYSLKNGTDTVTFLGSDLPVIGFGASSERLSDGSARDYVFGTMSRAVIPRNMADLHGTVLERGAYGFCGTVTDEAGNTVSDNTAGVNHLTAGNGGIVVETVSQDIPQGSVMARIVGNEDSFCLRISDSQNAADRIGDAYAELYGGRRPEDLKGYEFSLFDDSGSIPVTKLGKQTVDITMPVPEGTELRNMHIVSLDSDGQLEAVPYSLSGDQTEMTFRCSHFSPYGIYHYADSVSDLSMDGKTKIGKKDITPDTGDIPFHPKWLLVIGCVSASVVVLLLSRRYRIPSVNGDGQ